MEKIKVKVCVLGGGASGSVCAINLAEAGVDVCVVDGADFIAKKLLVTGNGKCNITNKNLSDEFYNTSVQQYFDKFNLEQTINFFNKIGVYFHADEEGRFYPISNSAKTVVHAIQKQFEKYKIKTFLNENVKKIEKNGDFFEILTENNEIFAEKIIFATGLNEGILQILNDLNIPFKMPVPSLVALKTTQNTKRLSGLRLANVEVTAIVQLKDFNTVQDKFYNINNFEICKSQTVEASLNKNCCELNKCKINNRTQIGEVLFKDDGISGICVFNLSSMFARENNFAGKLIIDLFPKTDIKKILNANIKVFSNVLDLLLSVLNKELALEILNRVNLRTDLSSSKLTEENLKDIIFEIKNFSFDVCGAYNNNQVLSGGVELENLSQDLYLLDDENIYFCGEICDVDGECGGYNLQWAWTSAMIVSNFIKKGV